MTDEATPTSSRYTRRSVLALGGAAGVTGLAGCSAERTGDDESDGSDGEAETPTLTVATYDSFIDAPSVSPGE